MAETRFEHNLRQNLLAVLDETANARHVWELVVLCHKLAAITLRYRKASGSFREEIIGLSPEDAGFDCIAELFHRDEGGSYVQLVAYFEGIGVALEPDEHLLVHLRRLVSAKVNEGLARLYHEADPILSKILRNIRLAVETLGHFLVVDRFGEQFLLPTMTDSLDHLPFYSADELERELSRIVRGSANVPTILSGLRRELLEQERRARLIPLMMLAFVIRAVHAKFSRSVEQLESLEPSLARHDLEEAIAFGLRFVRSFAQMQYVCKGKMESHTATRYLDIVEANLRAKLIFNDGEVASLYGLMKECIPQLTQEEYRAVHKAKLEYFLKLAQERIADFLSH